MMQLLGFPISLSPSSSQTSELAERFWYWQGASGRRYIHSVYQPQNCPPLPGAVFVGVKRRAGERVAVCLGRFLPMESPSHHCARVLSPELDEIHVHLLAKNPGHAEAVLADLEAAQQHGQSHNALQETPARFRPRLAYAA